MELKRLFQDEWNDDLTEEENLRVIALNMQWLRKLDALTGDFVTKLQELLADDTRS